MVLTAWNLCGSSVWQDLARPVEESTLISLREQADPRRPGAAGVTDSWHRDSLKEKEP